MIILLLTACSTNKEKFHLSAANCEKIDLIIIKEGEDAVVFRDL